jgi:putative FmdB family regulatory protein
MPIYEYRRPDGSTFEIQQPFSDDPLKKDPETGVPVERVLHAPAVHFKGKGFYNTDYGTRNRQRETAAAAEKKSGEKSSSGDGASAEKGEKSGEKSSTTTSSSSSSSSESKGKGDGKATKAKDSKAPAKS